MSQALDIFNLTSGAIGVASSIAQARNVDKVLILDQGSYTPVFEDAYPMKAIVRERARAMEHPIETGSIITDHRIILPIEIEIPLIVSAEFYQPTYQLIKQIYLSSALLMIQTRTSVYPNMMIAAMPHEETPEMFSAVTIALTFKEVVFAQPVSNFAPADPTQRDAAVQGQQQPVDYSPPPSYAPDVQTQVGGQTTTITGVQTLGGISSGGATGSW